jgi:P2 family phage contractile tail tube protein
MLPQTIRAMNLSVDGKGFLGAVEEVVLPKLKIKTHAFKAGGMDTPIELDMGLEKLECSFTVANYDRDLFKAFDITPNRHLPLTMRGAIEEDGTIHPVVLRLEGACKELDMGTWKSGEQVKLKMQMTLKKYELLIDDEEQIFVDVLNMVRRIHSVDVLEAARAAIGNA